MKENAIMTATTPEVHFKSAKLNEVTAEISALVNEVQTKANANHISICKYLARVADEKLYQDDGFKSATDYAMKVFGWKQANAYAMVQVGSRLNAGALPEGDFSVSQYREMLPLSKKAAEDAIENGIISSDMSAKEIRGEVEVLKPKKERAAKHEKVYKWYMDCIPGRKDFVATEEAIENAECYDIKQRVIINFENTKMVAYILGREGEIRIFVRGDECKEPVEEAEAENAE